MENEIRKQLVDELTREFEKISKLEPGSENHSKAVETVVKLYKTYDETIEKERNFSAICDQETDREREYRLKVEQMEEDKKNRKYKLILDGASIGVPLIFYGIWMAMGFKFEKDGTFTSTTFRNFFSKLRPGR